MLQCECHQILVVQLNVIHVDAFQRKMVLECSVRVRYGTREVTGVSHSQNRVFVGSPTRRFTLEEGVIFAFYWQVFPACV